MRKLSTGLPVKQAGFTLIELVIVIVIIGILAAVAIPKLSSVSDEATKAKNTAILGSLKSTWGIAYGVKKSLPGGTDVAGQMADPKCTASGDVVTCAGADTSFTLSYPTSGVPAWACDTPAVCL